MGTTRHIRPVGKAQTIDLLNRIAETHGAHHVIGVSETDLVMLRNAADDNKLPGIRVLVPLIEQLRLVNDNSLPTGQLVKLEFRCRRAGSRRLAARPRIFREI